MFRLLFAAGVAAWMYAPVYVVLKETLSDHIPYIKRVSVWTSGTPEEIRDVILDNSDFKGIGTEIDIDFYSSRFSYFFGRPVKSYSFVRRDNKTSNFTSTRS